MAPDLNQQIAHFEDRLRLDPDSRAFVPLADLYRRTGQLAHARDLLRNGVARHPQFLTARVALGLVLSELGEAEDAQQVMLGVLERDADNLLALRLMAATASSRGEWDDAVALSERLVRLSPEDREARELLQTARRRLQAGDDPVPVSAPVEPDSSSRGFESPTLAELYLRQGHPDKARVIVERILAADPERADARRVLARIEAHATGGAEYQQPLVSQANGESVPASPPQAERDLDRFRNWLDAAGDNGRGARN